MSEWISVDDRLPDEDEPVLAWADGLENYDIAWQHNSFWFNGYEMGYEPTHWQPLPPPPSAP